MKVLIDTGHGVNTPGKCSPPALKGETSSPLYFREYKYAREIGDAVVAGLKARGYDAERLVPEENDISLGERVRRANRWCDKLGAGNVIMVSIHVNAAGSGQWLNARGWSVYTTKGKTNSDKLAECLYKQAVKHCPGHQMRADLTDGDHDQEANFTVIYGTKCPSVLTENFFQDNKDDVAYLLSEEGRAAVTGLHVDGIIDYIKSR